MRVTTFVRFRHGRSTFLFAGILLLMFGTTLAYAYQRHWMQAPTLRLDSAYFEVGTVFQGQPIERVVGLHNAGLAPLLIDAIVPDCYCTVADTPRTAIAPGETRQVRIAVRTSGMAEGPMLRQVQVHSNDPSARTAVIAIRGTIAAEFSVSQTLVDFGSGQVGNKRIKTVEIRATQAGRGVLSVESTDESVTAAMVHGDDPRSVVIVLTENSPRASWHSGLVLVRTTSAFLPILRIPVRGFLSAGTSREGIGGVGTGEGPSAGGALETTR